ncbi:MAG: polysaccharide deacetylase family protein [Firmicutes bacterium]|jgi:polysaccharide deacetylase|nr:polysaccharide deacetylase family protein [Clostridia bacterium]MBS5022844.1 polysaccharide deacetylase family protein [Bacillota bacterium]
MKIICFKAKRFLGGAALLALALAVMWVMREVGSYAVSAITTARSLPIYSVEKEEKKISISFDCAWGTEHTDDLLREMERSNVRCTFFMVQFWTEKYPEYVKKIDEAGHEIGTHSKTHSYMSKQSESEIRSELESSSAAITAVTGKKVELFRPPYGDYDNLLIDTANSMGIYPIQWDVDSLDWKNLSATDIAMRVINGVKPGSIILCHNNGLHTAEALPLIFSTLQNRGYEFVPIGELIYRENYAIDSTGKQKPTKA